MTKIENETQYRCAVERVEELLPLVNDNTPTDDKHYVELVLLSNLVADYSDEHFAIEPYQKNADFRAKSIKKNTI